MRDEQLMQLTRFVRVLVLILVPGLAGSVVGCGPAAEQGPTAEGKEAAKAIAADVRKAHQQSKASCQAQGGANDLRRGKLRGKAGR